MRRISVRIEGRHRLSGAFPAAVLLAIGAIMAGCGSSSSSSSTSAKTTGSTKSSKPVRVAFLNQSITSYTIPMTQSMQAAAAANNATLKMFNGNNDPSTQLAQCKEAISGGYQAIILYPDSGAAAVPCVVQANAAHVQVVPVDSPVGPNPTSTAIQVPGIKAQVLGSALAIDANAAVTLVKEACSHFPPPCTIVQTEAIPAFFYSTYKVSHEQPKFKALGYKILATPTIGNFDDPSGTKSAIETVLAKYPSIDVIVSDDDSSVQGAVQLKRQGKLPKTLIIGDGGSSLAIKSIKQGNEFATSFSIPRTEAATALRYAVDLVRSTPIAKPNLTQLDMTKNYLITKANVSQVTPQW
jgi:ABC-type sugar transport system substrate-binding protein